MCEKVRACSGRFEIGRNSLAHLQLGELMQLERKGANVVLLFFVASLSSLSFPLSTLKMFTSITASQSPPPVIA